MSKEHLEQHPRVAVKSNGSHLKPAKGVGAASKIAQRGGDIPAVVPKPQDGGSHLSNSVRLDGPPRTAERGGQSVRGHVRGQVATRRTGSDKQANVPKPGIPGKDTKGLSITGVK